MKIDSNLSKLLPLSTKQKYDRLKQMTRIEENNYSFSEKEIFKTRITEFGFYVKKINPIFLGFK